MRDKLTRRVTIAGLALLGVLAAVGVAVAAIPSQNGVIHACYNSGTNPAGSLRVIDAEAGAKCGKNEKPLDFNQKGPKGDPGLPGPKGDPGPPGTSTAYVARNSDPILFTDLVPDLEAQDVVSKTVPAGSYAINAKLWAANLDTLRAGELTCNLVASGVGTIDHSSLTLDRNVITNTDPNRAPSASLAFQSSLSNYAGGTITVHCRDLVSTTIGVDDVGLTAVKVDSIG